jgi:ABC-2 type transport system ATP-binding protein
MMNKEAAVTVSGLTVQRGTKLVIADLSLTIPRGQVIGLLGPSGCGKSTLMRSIVGVQKVKGGTVTVLDLPAGSPALRHRVGYVTQSASIYEDLTVGQNLSYFARVLGADRSDVARVLKAVDLTDEVGSLTGNLSGGQITRVSLAVALLGSPELLILDEPTVGLDPVLRRDLWEVFRSLAASGITLLVSSHVMDEADRCDRLLLMRDGAILADTTPEELLVTTGASTSEQAFLTLIDRAARGEAA